MSAERKYVMSIAGLDPSGGAGLLADMKTFEQHKVYGLSVNTANTLQTEKRFHSIQWTELKEVLYTIDVLLEAYPVQVVKTGIVPSFDFLYEVVCFIHNRKPDVKIVTDPVLRSSSGYYFLNQSNPEKIQSTLSKISLLTPNLEEATVLAHEIDPVLAAKELSAHCPVLLKGGHRQEDPGLDHLYFRDQCIPIRATMKNLHPKHGSGCVLSAAIAANLAMENDLLTACTSAKSYVEHFLDSNTTLLGYHYV